MNTVIVSGPFDDIRSKEIRLLHEASQRGPLHVLLWDDETVVQQTGKPPKFPLAERKYFLEAIRYVDRVTTRHGEALPADVRGELVTASDIDESLLTQFPPAGPIKLDNAPGRKKVVVTGCFDWFHSGHVRFTEEVAELGDLYVVVGHDANIRLLKGKGLPLFPAEERRYVVDSIKYVKQALISSGDGWMDAEPEFLQIKPHIYAVNEDGDRPEKAAFCAQRNIEYRVLKREPKEGLTRRSSTALRGY